MCAIAGMIGLAFSEEVIDKMLLTMHRRGPDENGIFKDRDCLLLHSRLSIIDPDGGKQPMQLQWNGETYSLIYNGELYNTQEIRHQLEGQGHTFLGYSDTEVVLHAYAQWGEQCLERMNGIFAFGVWEQRKQRLFLARDRMGVKPIFYKCHNGGFLFASEIKTILSYPTVKPELDADGACEILLLGPGRTPGSGVFHGMKELEPGCCGYFWKNKWTWKRYWQLIDTEHQESFEETAEHVRYLVIDAICRQMVSDAPLGTFLSGGLDSSLISAICAEQMAEDGETLDTFSLDFKNNETFFVPEKFQPDSDNRYIEIMQQQLACNHHWTILTPEMLLSSLEASTVARDLPGMADVDFSLLLFCGEIRKKVKVALSGECADEIFGGYPWFRDPKIRSADGFPWAQNTQMRTDLLADTLRQKVNPIDFVTERYQHTIRQTDVLPGTSQVERRMKEMVNLNYRWFMQTLLDRKDRMSMFNSLEVRVPFCDYRIATYLYGVPWEFKNYKNQEKGLLRYAMEGVLPERILWRKKSPYPKTYDPKYLQLVTEKLKIIIQNRESPIFQIVNKDALEKLMHAEFSWPWYGQLMKLPQTIAYMLQVNYWLEKYNVILV